MGKYAKRLAENLKKLVPGHYSNQTDFAKAAGITQSQASLYISGEAQPKLDNLEGMAMALGVSVAGLIGEEAPTAAPPRKPTPEEFALMFLEGCDLEPKRKAIAKLALSAEPELINVVYDYFRSDIKRVVGVLADNKKPTAR